MSMDSPTPNPESSSYRPDEGDQRWTFPLQDADKCVKCALCLPHCPTYRESQDENESPRGRIALMQALAEGSLAPDKRLSKHLDQCLGCRNCEPVCPANVPYGRLIDAGHRLLREKGRKPGRLHRSVQLWMARPVLLGVTAWVSRLYRYSGLRRLAERTLLPAQSRLRRLSELLPEERAVISRAEAKHQPTPNTIEGHDPEQVQLFQGCISRHFDAGVNDAAEYLLRAGGIEVIKPAGQGCCGAPAQHSGDIKSATPLLQGNINAFNSELPIVASASGCTATLREYGEMIPDEDHERFASQVQDICTYLQNRIDHLTFQALPEDVALYLPCSQRNVVRGVSAIDALLKRIPKLRIHRVDDKGQCCGAAGAHLLTEPTMADQLGRSIAQSISERSPSVVLTTNVGCRLHLTRQLRKLGCRAPVFHPVELLARQLEI